MSKPVSGRRKLHWHEQVTTVRDPPIRRSVRHHIREDGWVAHLGQEICQDDPLITTAHFRANRIEVTTDLVDKAVMGFEEARCSCETIRFSSLRGSPIRAALSVDGSSLLPVAADRSRQTFPVGGRTEGLCRSNARLDRSSFCVS